MDKKKICMYVGICALVVALCVGGYFLLKDKGSKPSSDEDSSKYIEIFDSKKKILKSDLDLTENAKVNSSKMDDKNGIEIIDVIEPDFQFETHYLLVYNKDGEKILDIRKLTDKDNDNNNYKYNGKFEYENGKLVFYTSLFLGESDESTGTAFKDKMLSELTKDEKKKLGNYSDTVKYEYKFENKKMSFVKKSEVSKLKDNEYYKNELK